MRIEAKKQGTVYCGRVAIIADCLANGQNMIFIEAVLEGRTTVPGGAE